MADLDGLTPDERAMIEKRREERPKRDLTSNQELAQQVLALNEDDAAEFYKEFLGGAAEDFGDPDLWATTCTQRHLDLQGRVETYTKALAFHYVPCGVATAGYRNSIYSARENLLQTVRQ